MRNYEQYVRSTTDRPLVHPSAPAENFQFQLGVEWDFNRTFSKRINDKPVRDAKQRVHDLNYDKHIPDWVLSQNQYEDENGVMKVDYDKVIGWGRENIPDLMGDARTIREIEERTRKDLMFRKDLADDKLSRATFGGKVMGGLGMLVGAISEPAYIPMMFAGPARALTMSRYLKAAGLMGLMAGIEEGVTIPARYSWRTSLGDEFTTTEMALDMMMGVTMGGTLGAGGLGMMGIGMRKAMKRIPTKKNRLNWQAKTVLEDFLADVDAAPDPDLDPVAHFKYIDQSIIDFEGQLPPGWKAADLVANLDGEANVEKMIEVLTGRQGKLDEAIGATTEQMKKLEKELGIEGVEEAAEGADRMDVLQGLRKRLDELKKLGKKESAYGNIDALQKNIVELEKRLGKTTDPDELIALEDELTARETDLQDISNQLGVSIARIKRITKTHAAQKKVAKMTGDFVKDAYSIDTIPELTAWVMQHGDEHFKEIAMRIMPFVDEGKVSVLDKTHKNAAKTWIGDQANAAAFYDPNTREIVIRGKGYPQTGLQASSALHEALHSATYDRIRLAETNMASPQLRKAYRDLEKLSKAIQDEYDLRLLNGEPVDDGAKWVRYTTENKPQTGGRKLGLHEMLTYGMTQEDYQEFLASFEVAPGKTAWGQFVETIRQLLGLDDSQYTALDEILRLSDEILDPQVKPTKIDIADIKFPDKGGASAENIAAIEEAIETLEGGAGRGDDVMTFYGSVADDYGEVLPLKQVEEMIDNDVELLQAVQGCLSAVI